MNLRELRQKTAEKSHNFMSETYRIWVPITLAAIILWYFEQLNQLHEGADWLRSLVKLKHMSLGYIFGHLTWSLGFPYVKMEKLLNEDCESFRAVIRARANYYAACVIASCLFL